MVIEAFHHRIRVPRVLRAPFLELDAVAPHDDVRNFAPRALRFFPRFVRRRRGLLLHGQRGRVEPAAQLCDAVGARLVGSSGPTAPPVRRARLQLRPGVHEGLAPAEAAAAGAQVGERRLDPAASAQVARELEGDGRGEGGKWWRRSAGRRHHHVAPMEESLLFPPSPSLQLPHFPHALAAAAPSRAAASVVRIA